MINGVLVERTVKDVVPALKTNSEGLRQVLEDLVKQYNSKQTEMEKWKVRRTSDIECISKGQSADLYLLHRRRTISRLFSNKCQELQRLGEDGVTSGTGRGTKI
jgi:Prefoldin subunit